MENISEHISYKEATFSEIAVRLNIENIPSGEIIENMILVSKFGFEPLRKEFNEPLHINSFYRCPELNKQIGGASTSQHQEGKAIDISTLPGSKHNNVDLFNWLKVNVEFDQLIGEGVTQDDDFQWVHISYNKGNNRKEKLIADFRSGKAVYTKI